ncbi:hypothetical protein J4421_03540 [Candidatus Woesearchaeota archaeon]|nr:hypothetical protein [Candidatus Woesearchaeota archaeon]
MDLNEAIAELKAEKRLDFSEFMEILRLLEKAFQKCKFKVSRNILLGHLRYHYNISISRFLKKYKLFGKIEEVPMATISFCVFTTGERENVPLPLNIEVMVLHRSAGQMVRVWQIYLKVKEDKLLEKGIQNRFKIERIPVYKSKFFVL